MPPRFGGSLSAERCLGRRRDAGPSVALCGKMLGPEAGCRAICGLVRKDAWARGGMQGHLWPCAERCLGPRRDAGPSVALYGKMLGPEAGCRAICGLVRKDAWAGGGMQGHLWPCTERCLGRRRDAGPSVALYGKMPRRSGGPRAICGPVRTDACSGGRMRAVCGLVRKDAAPKRRTAGHLWPADPSAPQATRRHEMRPRVWWALPRLRALDLVRARRAAGIL